MRVLITGINGFVGGWLSKHCIERGDEVLGVVRAKDSTARDSEGSTPTVAWDVARPASPSVIESIAAFCPDAVFHLAGISNPTACGRDEPTEEAWTANVIGTANVVALLRSLPHRPRLVFASSSHVYAPASEGELTEDSPLGPAGAYGKTKAAAERILQQAAEEDGLDVVIARIFHHTGPGQPPPFLFGELLQQLVDPARDTLELQSLDFKLQAGDVRDLCRGLVALAERGHCGEAYNLAGVVARTGAEWLELLARGTGVNKPVVERGGARRPNAAANCEKAYRDTGFRPEIAPETTFRDMFAVALQRLQRP